MRTPLQIAAPVTAQDDPDPSRDSHDSPGARAEKSTHDFRRLLQALVEEFQPTTPTQAILVENMAVSRWRLLRIWSSRRAAETSDPHLLLRCEITYDRQFNRAFNRLLALQSLPGSAHHPQSHFAKRTQQAADSNRPSSAAADRPLAR